MITYQKYPQGYYVYAYLRNKDSKTAKAGTPYYIGKGIGSRAYEYHLSVPVPKNKNYIVILEQNLTELGALALERRYIRWYGRKDACTGILINKTDGGDGVSGRIMPIEERKRRSISYKGRKAWNKGISATPEHRQNVSQSLKGKTPWNKGIPTSAESNAKRTATQSNIPKPVIGCPHCNKMGGKPAMIRHHFDNCKSRVIPTQCN